MLYQVYEIVEAEIKVSTGRTLRKCGAVVTADQLHLTVSMKDLCTKQCSLAIQWKIRDVLVLLFSRLN
jgi:hypothetical protein